MTALYKYREEQNLTQRELASAVGVTPNAISQYKACEGVRKV